MRPSHLVDLVLLLILAGGVFRGYRTGLIGGLIGLAGIVIGLFLAPVLLTEAEPYLPEVLYGRWMRLLLFALAFILVVGLVVLIGKLVSKMVNWTPLGWINKTVGSLAGLLLSLLLASVLLNLAQSMGFLWSIPQGFGDLERRILEFLLWIAPAVFQFFKQWIFNLGAVDFRPPL